MIIANPTYDVVFKYLLDDLDIAKGLISVIIGEEIVSLEVKPQESIFEAKGEISVLRRDFKAVIKMEDGSYKKILIELQKAKKVLQTVRFRRYLGNNYRQEDVVPNEAGLPEQRPLPILTIYFLGFHLDTITNPIIRVNREYRDGSTNEIIHAREEFIELLTHDSIIVQLRRLKDNTRTALERVLQVFNPDFESPDPHMSTYEGDFTEPLVKKMVTRLGRAFVDDDMRHNMDVEDEIYELLDKKDTEIWAAIQEMKQEKQRANEEKQRANEEKQRANEEKQRADEEKLRADDLLKQVEELKKQLKKP